MRTKKTEFKLISRKGAKTQSHTKTPVAGLDFSSRLYVRNSLPNTSPSLCEKENVPVTFPEHEHDVNENGRTEGDE